MRVACIQLCSSRNVDENIAAASTYIRQAANEGAQLIATPEVTNLMEENNAAIRQNVSKMASDRSIKAFSALAAELKINLLIGSLALAGEKGKLVNRSVLFGPEGQTIAWYDKIHMFDVDLGGAETYRESANYTPGKKAVTADIITDDGPVTLGLSICYDLRFAYLYRALAKAGAQILMVPAAFTKLSGMAHWHVLLRARAIETGCFVMAPAQSGTHENGRKTFGHSLIVAPWGEIIAEAKDGPGLIVADLDLGDVAAARNKIPALRHDRKFSI